MKESSCSTLFGKRLHSARVMRKMSMDELIARMGDAKVSRPAISKYENGLILPSPETRLAIAAALDLDPSYFDQPLISAIEECKMDFRKKASMKTSDVNALREKVKDKVQRYLEIEMILDQSAMPLPHEELPHSNPISTAEEARAFAGEVREKWNLGVSSIPNIQQELERHGIMVLPVDEVEEFDGLSGKTADNKIFVVVNTRKDHIERRRLTVMHEVGHQLMVFNDDVNAGTQEKLCNVFANEMLLPESMFRTWLLTEPKVNLVALRPLQMFYGISIDAMMKKAEEIKLISAKEYEHYNVYKSMNKDFKDSVQASKYVESPIVDRFSFLVLRACSMDLISKERAKILLYDSEPDRKNEIMLL